MCGTRKAGPILDKQVSNRYFLSIIDIAVQYAYNYIQNGGFSMNKILLLEDDISLIDGLQYALEKSGVALRTARTVS